MICKTESNNLLNCSLFTLTPNALRSSRDGQLLHSKDRRRCNNDRSFLSNPTYFPTSTTVSLSSFSAGKILLAQSMSAAVHLDAVMLISPADDRKPVDNLDVV
ncbi:Inactive serine protease [Trichinella pseudospiralis]